MRLQPFAGDCCLIVPRFAADYWQNVLKLSRPLSFFTPTGISRPILFKQHSNMPKNIKRVAEISRREIQAGAKKFTLIAGNNHHGSVVVIAEDRADYRNILMVPGSAAQSFLTAFAQCMTDLPKGLDDNLHWPIRKIEIPEPKPKRERRQTGWHSFDYSEKTVQDIPRCRTCGMGEDDAFTAGLPCTYKR